MAGSITEKLELLGKGLYNGQIPDVITLKSLPTVSELDYVSSEDFEMTMLEKIFPVAIEEDFDYKKLLEIDFNWILRCLRILNYGPYHTTSTIFCPSCGKTSKGEYTVDLRTIGCKPLPDGFVNDIVVDKNQFLDFEGDVHFKLPTIQQMLNSRKDKAFTRSDGRPNRSLARVCYTISSIRGKTTLTPIEIKMLLSNNMSSADYKILVQTADSLLDFGLRAGGVAQCPSCGTLEGRYIALIDDRFFRPTLDDLRKWKHDRSIRSNEDVSRTPTADVRAHN